MHDDYGHNLILYENTLAHYGVRGMRWGVRHGVPSYAYAQSTIKKKKLQGKVDKLEKKASDAAYKASTGAKTKKYTKLQAKKLKLQAKKLEAQKKYDEWVKAMDEVFTSDIMKIIDPAAIVNAEEYIRTLYY